MEHAMSKRRLIHTLGTMAAIAACTRHTNLFRFFARIETDPSDRSRLAYRPYTKLEWDLLASTSPHQLSPIWRWALQRELSKIQQDNARRGREKITRLRVPSELRPKDG